MRDAGWLVNRKKIQRLWREEGLRVPPKRRKRRRLGESTMPADRLRATHPDHVWALDYQFDVTSAGRTIKILHVVDEHTRESLADVVAFSIDADATVEALDEIVAERGGSHPEFIRCNNGPELTANALRDWCRFGGSGTAYIDPGAPWQNPWVESYGSRTPRRTAGHQHLRQPARSPSPCRRLAQGVQHLPSPLRPGDANTRRVRSEMADQQPTPTLIAAGPTNGIRPRRL